MIIYIIMNINEYNDKFYGVSDALLHGQYDRVNEINDKIYERNIPTLHNNNLETNFDIRSVPTRNCFVFPILDKKTNIPPLKNVQKVEDSFMPVHSKGPVKKYLENIHIESELRNQIYALQHGAEQSQYVPSSKSELFKVPIPITTNHIKQPFEGLFHRESYHTTGNDFVNKSQMGKKLFNNCTQTQMGDI
jgi:hypothetical protein